MRHLLISLLCISAAICLAPAAQAQARLRQPEMYVGIHGGAIASTVNFSPSIQGMSNLMDATLLSGNGGLVFRYSAQKCCAIQVELNYMQRGWRERWESGERYTRRLDYIELPLLMHIYFGKTAFRGFFNLGPQIGYCLHESTSGAQPQQTERQYAKIDHPFDWGLAAGLGMYYRSQRAGVWQLEVRFCYSLGDIYSHSKMDYFAASAPMNLSINIGYLLEIKNKTQHPNK